MIMDWKRTCYSTKVRLTPDGPLFDLRWYRPHPKAKPFPHEHFGFSREWYSYAKNFGEVIGTKKYNKGENTHNKKGRCFRGDKAWYVSPGVTLEALQAAPPQVDTCTSCPARGARLRLRPTHVIETINFDSMYRTGPQPGPFNAVLPWCIYFTITCPDSSKSISGEFVSNGVRAGGYTYGVPVGPGTDPLFLGIDPRFNYLVLDLTNGPIGDHTVWSALVGNPVSFSGTLDHNPGDWFDAGTTLELHAVFVKPYYYHDSDVRLKFSALETTKKVKIRFNASGIFFSGPSNGGWSDAWSDGYGL